VGIHPVKGTSEKKFEKGCGGSCGGPDAERDLLVYLCIYTHTCIHTHTYTYAYTHTHAHTHTHTHTHTQYIHTKKKHTHTHTKHTHACMHACMHACTYTCTHTCMYMHSCMYIYTGVQRVCLLRTQDGAQLLPPPRLAKPHERQGLRIMTPHALDRRTRSSLFLNDTTLLHTPHFLGVTPSVN